MSRQPSAVSPQPLPAATGGTPVPLLGRYFGEGGTGASGPVEHWPAERLREYQREAIAEQLEHVYANNAFYRGKFDAAGVKPADFKSLEDLARFPFTTKDELRGDPWVLLSVPKDELCQAHTSTGTTGGVWSYILYSWEDMYVRDIAALPRLLMPVAASDVVINALPYEMSSAGQSFQRALQAGMGALVVPVGKGGFYSDPEKTVRIMADLAATVLITTPPYAMYLAEIAEEMGLPLRGSGTGVSPVSLRFMWLTGEGCSPAYRRRLEELWGCRGLIFYGSMECGSIGIECNEQSGSHVSEGHVYLEIVDAKTGQPVEPGQVGEVVCTVLQRKASPLVRFRTQDLAMLDAQPCPCGVRFPKLHIRGRIVDHVAGGADATPQVSPYMIEEVLYSQAEMGGNYQIWAGEGRVVIDAETRGRGDAETARRRIVDTLAQRGVKAELNWVARIARTGGKTRRVRPLAERSSRE